jgi:asparagine synthase (glutamine-hydrolysing)
MCGIAGIVRWQDKLLNRAEIERMTAAINHRGPDGVGFLCRDSVSLGHRRLTIIDPETGQQPMANADQTVWVTYNGEMYNFLELRGELQQKGHCFETRSDTEVVVRAYEEWGPECVTRFRGMFAFALADFRQRKLLLARDHFGIKPLYYRVGDGYFAFASELAALRQVDDAPPAGSLEAVELFMRFQYIPTPHTIYKSVFKLPPATYLLVDFGGRVIGPTRYWDFQFQAQTGITDKEWVERAESVIHDSVKAHLVADVPFGVFLSGGIDSSLVALQMSRILKHPVQAFAIGFEEKQYSELPYAQQVAERCGIELHSEIVREDMLRILPDLVAHYGEPFGDSSAIPTWYVSRLAREHVPMVLSGDGGDEGFAGYPTYQWWLDLDPLKHARNSARDFQPRAAFWWLRRALRRYLAQGTLNQLSEWQDLNTLYMHEPQRRALWRDEFQNVVGRGCEVYEEADARARKQERLSYAQYLDYQTYLPCDILTKVDVASMYHGLEVRTPLIDVRVMELAASLPVDQRSRQNGSGDVTGKYLLKKVLNQTFPKEFVHRKKQGFSIPRDEWFNAGQSGRRMFEEIVLDPQSRLYDWFKPEQVRSQLEIHGVIRDNSCPLWQLLVLGIWLEQNSEVHFSE